MRHASGQPRLRRVSTCWVLKIELVHILVGNIVARTWPNYHSIMQHPQMLGEKLSQHVVTHRNRVIKRVQHVAPDNVGICCVEMLPSFGRGVTAMK